MTSSNELFGSDDAIDLAINLALSQSSKESTHQALPEEVQKITQTAVVRMAGHDPSGQFLGIEKLLDDLGIVQKIEKGLVIDPKEAEEQLAKLKELEEDPSRDLQAISSFAKLGKHANLNSIETLLQALSKNGYVLLLEYTVDGVRVPGGYVYGFSTSFDHDDRFPHLGVSDISVSDDKINQLSLKKDTIVTNWRTGVPEDFSTLNSAGISIPSILLDTEKPELASPRRWGGGTALKDVIAHMGSTLQRTHLMLNVGSLEQVNELLGSVIANIASTLYNTQFLNDSGLHRKGTTDLRVVDEESFTGRVAGVRWKVLYGLLSDVIARIEADGGPLQGKGGWDLGKMKNFGEVIAGIDRTQLEQAVSDQLRKHTAQGPSSVTSDYYLG